MGERLLQSVVAMTGLPSDLVTQELERLIVKAGLDKDALTLEDLRAILAEYLQDTLLQIKNNHS